MNTERFILTLVLALLLVSCAPKEIQPVELYPEDECAECRMAISNAAFASEIINKDGTVMKFDDLKCLEDYRKDHSMDDIDKMFVKNYDTKEWLPFGKSIVIQTGIDTPMGSGQVAVADQQRAKVLLAQYPPDLASLQTDNCCKPNNN